MEWCDPVFAHFVAGNGDFKNQRQLCEKYSLGERSLISAFEVYGLIMKNEKEMRTSKELTEFYQS